MPSTRREPEVERTAALHGLRGAVLYALLAAGVWWGAERAWPDDWLEPDLATRDRIVRIAAGVLVAIAAWCLTVGSFHAARWARASHWERMLDDPVRAHLVPPLKSHAESVASAPGGCALAVAVVALGLGGVGLVVYGVLALDDRVTRVRSDGEDQSPTMVVIGIMLVGFGVAVARKLRQWQIARRVERLSNDDRLVAARVGIDTDGHGRRIRRRSCGRARSPTSTSGSIRSGCARPSAGAPPPAHTPARRPISCTSACSTTFAARSGS